jgi:Xaa-Pro aminopeptidase
MHKIYLYIVAIGILPFMLAAQQMQNYPQDYLSPAFHAGRREAFKASMSDKGVAVFFASQVRVRNDDVDYQYAQNKNFYYFTGLQEPNAVLLLFKRPVTLLNKTGTEFIFVQKRDPQKEMWTGRILGEAGVQARYELQNVFANDQFTANTLDLSSIDSVYSLYRNEEIFTKYKRRLDPLTRMATILDSAIEASKKPLAMRSMLNTLRSLRGIKQPEEIAIMRKAANISSLGHREVMKAIKPGIKEYQAQAIMEYHFKSSGSEYAGYPSIVGAAENACVLHYTTNLKQINDGELLLSDCAAEYHGYTADVTRTIPANGKFSKEQKLIYDLVLKAQDAGIQMCKSGIAHDQVDVASREVIYEGLVKLGIVSKKQDARQYFPHGTSHHVGLDVHDLGPRILLPGVIVTVEPGIYIPAGSKCDKKWWDIGVRIEDDILITETGNENLSAGSPRSTVEIEKLIRASSKFEF